MIRLIWGKKVRVKSSGEVVFVQVWLTEDNEIKYWLDNNWYSPDCFETIN